MLAKVFHGMKWDWIKALELAKDVECQRCGKCCKNVRLDNIDIRIIANYLKKSKGEIKGMLKNGCLPDPCPFLEDNSCSIYEARPIRCRTYPINPYPDSNNADVMVQLCPAGEKLTEKIECRLRQ